MSLHLKGAQLCAQRPGIKAPAGTLPAAGVCDLLQGEINIQKEHSVGARPETLKCFRASCAHIPWGSLQMCLCALYHLCIMHCLSLMYCLENKLVPFSNVHLENTLECQKYLQAFKELRLNINRSKGDDKLSKVSIPEPRIQCLGLVGVFCFVFLFFQIVFLVFSCSLVPSCVLFSNNT